MLSPTLRILLENAVKTLVTMGTILAVLLVGIVGLSYVYGVMPQTETTVLSQLASKYLVITLHSISFKQQQ